MELEEAEDEEHDSTSNTDKYLFEPNGNCNNEGGNARWMFNKGLNLGKKILVAGFVASSAPLVFPPLVVASAIGIAVSMPYALFFASHACTQNLMSKLLPNPNPNLQNENPLLLEEARFEKDESDERKREFETVGVQGNECEQDGSGFTFFVEEEEKAYLEKHDGNDVELGGEIDDGIVREEGNEERLMSGGSGSGGEVVTIVEGFDKIGNEVEEFVEVTTVVLEESHDEGVEGGNDIEEEELHRETKGLLEKIRDEGRSDRREEYVCGGIEGEVMNEEDLKVSEDTLISRNDENMDFICNEVEPGEPLRGFDDTNESQEPMAEPSDLLDGRSFQDETIPNEPIGDLPIEARVFNVSFDEDSSEVTVEKTDLHITFEEDLMPLPDGPTILQDGILDNDISDIVNEESQLHEYNVMMDSLGANAREIADESGLDVFDDKRIHEYGYTIGLHEESLSVNKHTDSMEVLVSSVEQESGGPSDCSSGKSLTAPSQEVEFNEENIWKQIHVIRKIVGYEGKIQPSCVDELKALYIFTGVEPPMFPDENSGNPAEINEKLHFLMSIVGIKSNDA